MEESRSGYAWIVAGVLLLLPLAYYGSYRAMLEKHGQVLFFYDGGSDRLIRKEPIFRIQHPVVMAVFTPATWVDQRIRPETWENAQD